MRKIIPFDSLFFLSSYLYFIASILNKRFPLGLGDSGY